MSRDENILRNILGANADVSQPYSRMEKILLNMLGCNYELEPPQSRVEVLLHLVLDKIKTGEISLDTSDADE